MPVQRQNSPEVDSFVIKMWNHRSFGFCFLKSVLRLASQYWNPSFVSSAFRCADRRTLGGPRQRYASEAKMIGRSNRESLCSVSVNRRRAIDIKIHSGCWRQVLECEAIALSQVSPHSVRGTPTSFSSCITGQSE